jgi:hypothetical protein
MYTSNYAYSKVVQKVLNNEKKKVILSPTQHLHKAKFYNWWKIWEISPIRERFPEIEN